MFPKIRYEGQGVLNITSHQENEVKLQGGMPAGIASQRQEK